MEDSTEFVIGINHSEKYFKFHILTLFIPKKGIPSVSMCDIFIFFLFTFKSIKFYHYGIS